jgi:mannose-6-phosphate isomerase-like protein (cupin superfamily)
MDKQDCSRVLRFSEAQGSIPGPKGEHAAQRLKRGPLDVALSIPRRPTQQTAHVKDETYLIVRGRALFLHDGKHHPVGSGELVFVAAGAEHQFEDNSEDLAVWRVLYGPHGGEVPPPGCQSRSAR